MNEPEPINAAEYRSEYRVIDAQARRRDPNAGYPGEVTQTVTKPQWDGDTCTDCTHDRAEHQSTTGCTHTPSERSLAFCFCPVRGAK